MSFTLDKIFTTATALVGSSSVIREVAPCDALKPYVRCFWETDGTPNDTALRIIPDCCADVLTYLSDNKIHSDFCGVSNQSFISRGSVKTFGIRFYAWSVCLFSSVDMNGTLNNYLPAEAIFNDFGPVAQAVMRVKTTSERIEIAQKYLLDKLRCERQNSDVMNSLYKIISQRTQVNVATLSEYCATSKRALERKFRAQTGLSPKEMIELVRYQMLWQQCLQPNFNALDSVEKLGFYDAAHLYNDFKKYHGLSLPQALKSLKLSHFYNT